MKRVFTYVVVGLIFALLGLIVLGMFEPARASIQVLPLGWYHFLRRNISHVTWNWSLFLMAVTCSLLMLVIGTWLGGILTKRWDWRWSLRVYVALWILFGTAFGAVGLARHTGWLMNEREPWYEPRVGYYLSTRRTEGIVETSILENEGDIERSRRAILSSRGIKRGLVPDEFDVLLYGDRSNRVAVYVLIPREQLLATNGLFLMGAPDDRGSNCPMSELSNVLARLEREYPSNRRNR